MRHSTSFEELRELTTIEVDGEPLTGG